MTMPLTYGAEPAQWLKRFVSSEEYAPANQEPTLKFRSVSAWPVLHHVVKKRSEPMSRIALNINPSPSKSSVVLYGTRLTPHFRGINRVDSGLKSASRRPRAIKTGGE